MIDVGSAGNGGDVQSLAELSLPSLSASYAALVSAYTEHSAAGETGRYYLERNGFVLASGTAAEIASLIDDLAMTLVDSPSRGDLNGDGSVTATDITVFIETLGGVHDGTDLPALADLDADMAVDASDLLILMENLGD